MKLRMLSCKNVPECGGTWQHLKTYHHMLTYLCMAATRMSTGTICCYSQHITFGHLGIIIAAVVGLFIGKGEYCNV